MLSASHKRPFKQNAAVLQMSRTQEYKGRAHMGVSRGHWGHAPLLPPTDEMEVLKSAFQHFNCIMPIYGGVF